MGNESQTSESLLVRAQAGDAAAWGALLAAEQERLTRMVAFRMDPRLASRLDAADVVQEAFLEAWEHRDAYFRDTTVPLFLWLRGVVGNRLMELHRRHLGTRMRDMKRERPLEASWNWDNTSGAICEHLTGHLTSPSAAAARGEVRARLADALDDMDPTDREVLAMRHFEQLTNAEAAQVLGIQERATAKRYLRALGRLKQILSDLPGGLTELRP